MRKTAFLPTVTRHAVTRYAAVLLTAVLLTAALAGCGGTTGNPPATATPSPSASQPAATGSASPSAPGSSTATPAPSGASVKTLTGTVKSVKDNVITIDLINSTIQSSPAGDAGASASPTAGDTLPSPSSGQGVTQNVPVTIPDTAVITLLSGQTGTVKDIKKGNTILITITGADVTAVQVTGPKK
jgi:hypothetical protein